MVTWQKNWKMQHQIKFHIYQKNHGEFINRFRHLIDAINKYLTENGIMTENRDDTISFDGYVRKLQKAANEYDFPAIEAIKKDMEELSMSDHQKEKYKMIRQMIEDTVIVIFRSYLISYAEVK